VLGRLEAPELESAGSGQIEIDRDGARLMLRVDRFTLGAAQNGAVDGEESQLALFAVEDGQVAIAEAPRLPELVPVPEPPENRVRRLSYSALALFELCSYRFYVERFVGLRETRPMLGDGDREPGLAATEIGDSAHVILEGLDLADPRPPEDIGVAVRTRYPMASDEEVARIGALVEAYCSSEIAQRLAGLPGATVERSFAFEHDGVLIHGRLDVFHEADGKALVVDYKTNVLEEASPAEVVEREYRIQRLVYALAILRAGVSEVEVVYQFLERPNDLVTLCYKEEEVAALEAELSQAIAAIQAGKFRPTPSEYACSTCPALNLVCAGPNLRAA
jgi:ATP-dependent helicase/nuclease subunit A